jgi:4-amino-4-deoxy-L-arabinose transferase-like glycosyltransferase
MMGCAALTKGPMGIIVPGAVYVVYALLSGSARRGLARPEPYLALTLALLVCLPWYAAQIHHYGQEYVDEFFGRQNVRRYTQAQDGLGPLGWLWPIPTVLLFAFPASVLLPSALRGALTALRAARDGSAAPRWRLFLALWALANVVLFAPCATRLPHYLMGVYPPAALLLADMLVREAFEAPPAARRSRWVAGALIGAGLLLAGGFAYGALHAAVLAPMANLHNVPLIAAVAWLLAACFAVAGCACAAAWVRLRGLRLVAAQWGMLLLVALAIADVTWPAVGITREQGLKELALGSRATLPPGARLITYGFDSSVVVYYSRHEQRRAPNTQPAEALRLLAERPGSRLITTEAWWPRLPRGKLVVVGGAPPYILAVLRE